MGRPIKSPRGFAGALVLLLGVPMALAAATLGGDAEIVFHLALGASFALFALAVFDFQLPRWFSIAISVAIGVLAAIFLLQGAADLTQSPALRHIAYDVLGQRFEKALGYVFLLWCLSVIVMEAARWMKALGATLLAAILGVEVYGAIIVGNGGEQPGALKLLYLPLFVWLLLESLRPVAHPAGSSVPLA